jgi:hypothetical protein
MLATEIETSQRLVRTDAYQMSVGEIVNMYKDGELKIDPEFQRLFRWEPGQKSKLIESMLLGIPLPPIFVFENEDAKWELIDGLQRLSTILEFMGLLKNPDGTLRPPSFLESTKYLPSLRNSVWETSEEIVDLPIAEQVAIDKAYQLAIRRSRLGVEILKRPSDNNTKFDLFQRLNAAGTPANPQEIRNCVVIMVSSEFFRFVKGLAEQPAFQRVCGISEEQIERQKHLEFACRFLTHTFVPYDGMLDVEEFIDEGIKQLAERGETQDAAHRFQRTFDILDRLHGGEALRRIDDAGRHVGRIGLAAFECIAVGIGRNMPAIDALPDADQFISEKIRTFWQSPGLDRFLSPGQRGTTRIQRTIPFGEGWFRP